MASNNTAFPAMFMVVIVVIMLLFFYGKDLSGSGSNTSTTPTTTQVPTTKDSSADDLLAKVIKEFRKNGPDIVTFPSPLSLTLQNWRIKNLGGELLGVSTMKVKPGGHSNRSKTGNEKVYTTEITVVGIGIILSIQIWQQGKTALNGTIAVAAININATLEMRNVQVSGGSNFTFQFLNIQSPRPVVDVKVSSLPSDVSARIKEIVGNDATLLVNAVFGIIEKLLQKTALSTLSKNFKKVHKIATTPDTFP